MNLINGNPAADKTIPGKGGQPSFSGILCREWNPFLPCRRNPRNMWREGSLIITEEEHGLDGHHFVIFLLRDLHVRVQGFQISLHHVQ